MKFLKFLILAVLISSCAKSDSEDEIEDKSDLAVKIESITSRAKIGDTITITGANLNKVSQLYLKHDDILLEEHNVKLETYSFLSKSDEKITFRTPTLVHENITIYIPIVDSDYKFDLVGFIPVQNDISVYKSQTLTNEIAYITDRKKIYKSSDGYYNWDVLVEFTDKNITSFFFLNENIGWIAVTELSGRNIYLTIDGGLTFTLKYHINDIASNSADGSAITKMQFTSQNKGLFKDGNANIFVADTNSFENVYDYYPSLSTLPFGRIEFYDLNAINDDLVFLSPNGAHYLIKIDNQNITYSEFDFSPLAPQFFGDIGYVKANSDIYKTTDLGDSWSKIKTFDNYYPRLHFFNENVGFAIVNYTPEVFYKTIDGGASWIDYWTPPYLYNNEQPLVTPKNVWLLGDLWKYIEE